MITLNNGVNIPCIGYGSAIVLKYMWGNYSKKCIAKYWVKNFIKDKEQFKKDRALKTILNISNVSEPMLIDTSRAYAGSEYVIGKSILHNRDKYFIATKLCNTDQYNHKIEQGFMTSLKNLNTDHVDLYLMHWPVEGEYINSWRIMETLYEKGLAKSIGVCNCNIHHLEELRKHAKIMPMVNQFECHPLFTQNELRAYCKENNIQVMAYTPTARMDNRLFKTVLPKLAKKYGKTVAQIIIRWHIQIGNIPIVNTSNLQHLAQNYDVFDFELTEEEIESITKININSRLRYDPDNCDFRQL